MLTLESILTNCEGIITFGDKKDLSVLENAMEKCLNRDWSLRQINHALVNRNPKITDLRDILYPSDNLVPKGKTLYHAELRIVPPPPKAMIDDDGNLTYIDEEDWFLEMVKVYTPYHLLKYYYKTFTIEPTESEIRRDGGGFKYVMKANNLSLDKLLFVIDSTNDWRSYEDDGPPRGSVEIQDYIQEGLEAYENKVAYDRMVGIIGV
jgi:hypothetical protein